MMQHMRTHDDWPSDEAAASIIAQIHKNLATQAPQAVQKSEDMQKLPTQFPFFPMPAMMEGSSKGGVSGMPHGVPMMIPWMGMSGMSGVPSMPATSAGAGSAAPPTPTTPVSATSSAPLPPTTSTRSRSESTKADTATPIPASASAREESERQSTPLRWATEEKVAVLVAQPTKAADEDEDEDDPIDDNDQDEDYTGRAKKRKKPVRGAAARSRAQRRAAGDKGASPSRAVAHGMLPFPGTGMFGPGMFPQSPGGMQLPPGMPFAPPAGIQLSQGMPLQLPHGLQFPPLLQLPPGMQFPPVPMQPGQVIQVMVSDGKGGMQLVHMPMMPPGWTADDAVEGGGAAEGVADGAGPTEESGADLSIGTCSNAEVAEDAIAAALEDVTTE